MDKRHDVKMARSTRTTIPQRPSRLRARVYRVAPQDAGRLLLRMREMYYPTLEELEALPREERNRRVALAFARSGDQTHDDLEGYTDADFDNEKPAE